MSCSPRFLLLSGSLLMACLGGALIGRLDVGSLSGSPLAVAFLIGVLTLVTLAPIVLPGLRNGEPLDPFSPMVFWGLYSLSHALRVAQIAFLDDWNTNWFFQGQHTVAPLLVEALALLILGRIALTAGFFAPWGARIGRSLASPPAISTSILSPLLVPVLGLLGLASYVYLLSLGGGLESYLDNLGRKREVLTGNFTFVLGSSLLPLAFHLLLVWSIGRRHRWGMIVSAAGIAFSFCVIATIGTRTSAIYVLLTAVIIVHYTVRRIPTWSIVALGLLLFQFVQVFGEARMNTARGRDFILAEQGIDNPFVTLSLFVSEWGAIDRFLVFIDGVPEEIEFQYFTTYTRFFTVFVPRALWEDKPGLTEANVYSSLFVSGVQNYATLPAGVTADYYLQAGVFGVVILWLLTGVVMRAAHAFVAGRPGHAPGNAERAWLYAITLLTIGEGLVNVALVAFATQLASAFVVLWIARAREPMQASDRVNIGEQRTRPADGAPA